MSTTTTTAAATATAIGGQAQPTNPRPLIRHVWEDCSDSGVIVLDRGDCLAVSQIMANGGKHNVCEWDSWRTGWCENEEPRLRKLDLGGFSVESLPNCIGQLGRLQELNLSGTRHLSNLPQDIGNLADLKKLNLFNSPIPSLPNSIGQLGSLQDLDLSHTSHLSVLPQDIGNLANMKKLNLNCSSIQSLPNSIGQLGGLQDLNLSCTRHLSALPQDIGQLGSLQELNLSHTSHLSALPQGIGNLANLKNLDLCGSSIQSLPNSIGQLGSLQDLNLSCTCHLSALPQDIGNLANLENLDLHCSSIQSLPNSIGKLSKLDTLDLNRSCIGSLPDTIDGWVGLKFLQCDHCSIPVLKEGSPIRIDYLSMLVKRLPVLGCLPIAPYHWSIRKKLGYALACNRARSRMRPAPDNSKCLVQMVSPALWPRMMARASMAFAAYPFTREAFDFTPRSLDYVVGKPDAIYRLLVEARESFVILLVGITSNKCAKRQRVH